VIRVEQETSPRYRSNQQELEAATLYIPIEQV
jgi:hypothetical protein